MQVVQKLGATVTKAHRRLAAFVEHLCPKLSSFLSHSNMPGLDTMSGSTPGSSSTSRSPLTSGSLSTCSSLLDSASPSTSESLLTCTSPSDPRSPDLDRSWKMFPRKWVTANDLDPDADSGMTFTLMTYNVLTERCMPVGGHLYCDPECRSMEVRHPRILEEIQTLNPDILCLQEVDQDHHDTRMRDDLTSSDYTVTYMSREDDQGLVVAHKRSAFSLLGHKESLLHELAEPDIQVNVAL